MEENYKSTFDHIGLEENHKSQRRITRALGVNRIGPLKTSTIDLPNPYRFIIYKNFVVKFNTMALSL